MRNRKGMSGTLCPREQENVAHREILCGFQAELADARRVCHFTGLLWTCGSRGFPAQNGVKSEITQLYFNSPAGLEAGKTIAKEAFL